MSSAGNALRIEDASRLAAKLRLAAVHVSGLKAEVTTGGVMTGNLGWKLVPMKLRWGREENQVRVLVPASLHVLREVDGQEKAIEQIALLAVLLRLDYDVAEDGEPEAAVDSFVGISGTMHAWPYIRAEIQQLSAKLELPGLLLPSIVSGDVPRLVEMVKRLEAPEAPPADPRTRRAQSKGKKARGRKPKIEKVATK